MDFWRGYVDWPIVKGWKCQTCNNDATLMWGIINGQCRCVRCHTEYSLRDGDNIVDVPICLLKEEYKQPVQIGYAKYKLPISQWDGSVWDEVMGDINGYR